MLFPFSFHVTGMPMEAAARKLERELPEFGSPCPTFPAGRPRLKFTAEGFLDLGEDGEMLTLELKPRSTVATTSTCRLRDTTLQETSLACCQLKAAIASTRSTLNWLMGRCVV